MKKYICVLMCVSAISFADAYSQYDIVVAKDGSGNYTTVQAAVNAAPSNSSSRTEIYIKNGSYYEVITVPSNKTNLTFIGQSLTGTVLTYDNAANKINPATGQPYGTSNSASCFINGAGFYATNLSFANTASPSLGQAVAVRSTADKAIFKNCRFLGNQDTYYAHSGRSYHESCYFEGTTDFIFGGAISFFENCDIYCKGGTSVTAASTAQHIQYGYVFNNCRITGAGTAITDLGRPWGAYASVTFRNTNMSAAIKAAGWNDWGNAANQATARFNEYSNSGSGYVPASRPSWVHILSSSQAQPYTMLNVLKANSANPQVIDNWNPMTTINATPGVTISAFSTIQAENYSAMLGIQTETCSEGGLNVGYIHNSDWIRFNSVNFGSGVSGFSARVACNATGGAIKLRIDAAGGTQIGSCNVTNTGGWQNWTTVNTAASGVSGVHDLFLSFSGGEGYLLNLNHFVFTPTSNSRLEVSELPVSNDNHVRLFPDPADQQITIDISQPLEKDARILITDIMGRQVLKATIQGNKSTISVGRFLPGVYIIRLFNGPDLTTRKFVKR
ncbi:MAG TPA: pectinesterase family protein [Niastella sp.]